MVRVQPYNSKGEPSGAIVTFTDERWEKMKRIFGKKLAFRVVTKETKDITEVNLKPKVSTLEAKPKAVPVDKPKVEPVTKPKEITLKIKSKRKRKK